MKVTLYVYINISMFLQRYTAIQHCILAAVRLSKIYRCTNERAKNQPGYKLDQLKSA